jgi:hypothetical protein
MHFVTCNSQPSQEICNPMTICPKMRLWAIVARPINSSVHCDVYNQRILTLGATYSFVYASGASTVMLFSALVHSKTVPKSAISTLSPSLSLLVSLTAMSRL